jgi:hypothetical protein
MKSRCIEILHKALHPFLHDLTSTCLRRFASYYYKNAKHNKMHLNPNYFIVSCKKIGKELMRSKRLRKIRVSTATWQSGLRKSNANLQKITP